MPSLSTSPNVGAAFSPERSTEVGWTIIDRTERIIEPIEPNFERPFTPRTSLRLARNFGNARFRRFANFEFLTPKIFFRKKNLIFFPNFFFGVKKSKFANRLKRALPKFRGDRSEVRGVNGRSKFVAASAGFAKRKQYAGVSNPVRVLDHGY